MTSTTNEILDVRDPSRWIEGRTDRSNWKVHLDTRIVLRFYWKTLNVPKVSTSIKVDIVGTDSVVRRITHRFDLGGHDRTGKFECYKTTMSFTQKRRA